MISAKPIKPLKRGRPEGRVATPGDKYGPLTFSCPPELAERLADEMHKRRHMNRSETIRALLREALA